MNLSLRNRFLAGVILGTAVLLGLFSIILYTTMRRALLMQFDRSLLNTARLLSAVIEDEGALEDQNQQGHQDEEDNLPGPRIEFEFDVRMIPEFNTLNGGAYYQFQTKDGNVLARSPSLGDRDLAFPESVSETPRMQSCLLPDGKQGRAAGYQFIPKEKGRTALSIVVARDTDTLNGQLQSLRWLLTGASAVVIGISLLIAIFITRTGLKPIRRLADEIETLDAENLGSRHFSQSCPAELVPVVDCLNDLFGRLQAAFSRQRQFNTDAAHELRTPLAGLQATIEVCLSRMRQPEEYRTALQDCLEMIQKLHRLTETLLSLTRLETNAQTLQTEPVCLHELITGLWAGFSDRAAEQKLHFQNNLGREITCLSNRDLLSMILFNLIDNAVEYTDTGGHIRIEGNPSSKTVTLSVSNSGCRLAPEDLDHLFDSFWRGDKSRKDTGKHCGIGLSAAKRAAKALDGRISARIKPNGLFLIELELPTA